MSIMKINSGIEIDTKNNFLLAEVIDTSINKVYLISRTELEYAKTIGDSKIIEMLSEYGALENIDNIVSYTRSNNLGNYTLDLEGNGVTIEQYCSSYRTIKQIDDTNKYIPQSPEPQSKEDINNLNSPIVNDTVMTSTDFNTKTEQVIHHEQTIQSKQPEQIIHPEQTIQSKQPEQVIQPEQTIQSKQPEQVIQPEQTQEGNIDSQNNKQHEIVDITTLIGNSTDLDEISNNIFKSSKRSDEFYIDLLKHHPIEIIIDNSFQLVTKYTIIDNIKVDRFKTVFMEDTQFGDLDIRVLAGKVYALFAKHILDLYIIETDKVNKINIEINSKTTPIVEAVVEDHERKIEDKTKSIIERLKSKYFIDENVENVLYDNIIKKIGGK